MSEVARDEQILVDVVAVASIYTQWVVYLSPEILCFTMKKGMKRIKKSTSTIRITGISNGEHPEEATANIQVNAD